MVRKYNERYLSAQKIGYSAIHESVNETVPVTSQLYADELAYAVKDMKGL